MILKVLSISLLIAVVEMAAYGAPKADPEKPLYQFKWGGPPPCSMTFFGAMEEVTVEKELVDSESEKSADMWQDMAKWSAVGALALTLLWYFSSKRELGGAAGVALLCSLGCTVMAEIVTKGWLIALLVIFVGVVLILGYLWRDKSIWKWYKDKRKTPLKDQQGEGQSSDDHLDGKTQ
jgi:uncharacterized membrane protein (DUF485 family)